MKKYFLISSLLVFLFAGTDAKTIEGYHLSSAQTTPSVIRLIRENYIYPSRINASEMLKEALNQIQRNVAEIITSFDDDNTFSVTIDQAVKKFEKPYDLPQLLAALKNVYSFIDVHYHGEVKPNDIEYLALDGMLNTLDPHSNILPPKVFNEFRINTKGRFGGLGIVIETKDGVPTVVAPIEGTPAWRAGVKTNDRIVQIGEESTINMTLTEAVEKLRGIVGTEVTINIERPGKPSPFIATLKRAIINIDSVQSTVIPVGERSVGYIKIKSFQEDTDKEFTKQLAKIKEAKNFSGLILDMRNNPGGLLNQAVAIVDKFISEGVIVATVGAENKFLEREMAKKPGTEPDYPMMILVNEGSASASEIVAGALQSYKRGTVVGHQTFGKGSVQTLYDIHDGSALKLTVAEYLTAGKNSIQSIGVTPDIKMVPITVSKELLDLIEDEIESEEKLDGHLSKSTDKTGEAQFKLAYLPPFEKEDEEKARRSEYSKTLNFTKDFPVQFASQAIASGQVASTVASSEKLQQSEIVSSLTKLGVDWSECPQTGQPVLQISFLLKKNGQAIKQALAGDEVGLVLNAKNIGTGSFCKLAGSSTSTEFILKNKEFVFGRLGPGESRSWSTSLKIGKSLVTKILPFTIKFFEANNNVPADFHGLLPIQELPQPQFAYSFKIGTPQKTKVQKEKLPKEKTIPLILNVKNIGKGSTDDVIALIKNPEEGKGIFIGTGRVKIGRLEPGQSKTATLNFRIEPSFDDTAFKLELTILDKEMFTTLTKEINFDVANGVTTPPSDQWLHGPKIELATQSFPITTSDSRQHIEAKISDDQAVKDYYIFVGDEKVAYAANPAPTTDYKLSVDLSLKDGNNDVSIVARDNQDMSTRYSLVIDKK